MPISIHRATSTTRIDRHAGSLGAGEIQVWLAGLHGEERARVGLLETLSAGEIERAGRFREPRAARRFLLGHALLRRLLGACLGVAPADVEIGYLAHGKPVLAGPSAAAGICFNLSRTGDRIAIALTRGRRVGIDLESPGSAPDLLALAPRILSAVELAGLQALPEGAQRGVLLQAWTCKEAYLKATGEGLSTDPRAVRVSIGAGTSTRLTGLPGGAKARRRWRSHPLPLPEDLAGTLVVEAAR